MLADVVLPAAIYLEYDSVEQPWDFPMVGAQQRVAQTGECRSDSWILNELARKMGFHEHVWSDMKEPLDIVLKDAGLTFEAFRKIGTLIGEKMYRHYEKEGFGTPSGKVELYSERLESWGYDPLPTYREPPETPYSEPEGSEEYPLIMTSHKDDVYRHSGGRQIASLRRALPEPGVRIHPLTAEKLRIEEGAWVHVSTRRGTIRLKARLLESLDPRTVVLDYAWWYPEKKDSLLFAWDESNINVLTSNKPPFNPEMGTPSLRGIFCRVSRQEP
jgi:anaerobic selenocysteine-containing dehydrogenase